MDQPLEKPKQKKLGDKMEMFIKCLNGDYLREDEGGCVNVVWGKQIRGYDYLRTRLRGSRRCRSGWLRPNQAVTHEDSEVR